MSTTPESAADSPRPPIPAGPLLCQLAGMPEARAWGEGLAQDLALYKAKRLAWSEIDPGCVFYGPPGTGKTTLARAIAATAKVPLIATSYAEWSRSGQYVSDFIRAMHATFRTATQNAPCIVAIDELDSMPARGSLSAEHPGTYAIVNALLEQLDGLDRRPGVVVIGTCNHPDRLDPALVRAGRLGRSIEITLPSLDALPQIIAFHLGAAAKTMGDLSALAVMCAGMSGADIEQLVRDARQRARRAGHVFARADIVGAIEARTRTLAPQDQRRVAVHEAGHAFVALRLGVSDNITVSVVSAGGSAGRMVATDAQDALTRARLEDRLTVLLAGRAAEAVLLGSVSGGAGGGPQSDLALATKFAYEAVGALGLSSTNSLLWHGNPGGRSPYPPAVTREVEDMLAQALKRALDVIRSAPCKVDLVADALVARRALSHDELSAIADPDPPCIDLKHLDASVSMTTLRNPKPIYVRPKSEKTGGFRSRAAEILGPWGFEK